jgi:hypothetical protein
MVVPPCSAQVEQLVPELMNQEAVIVAMVGSATNQKANDSTSILNSACHEGWGLLNGSLVLVEQGQQGRGKDRHNGHAG